MSIARRRPPPCAAVPVSNARAEASRRNGAKSRGPKTPEGRARSAQNALKHGMRAQKHLVLPDEDGAEFAALEAALVAELLPVGALQTVLARRVAVAAWRLARADRIEIELFEERRVASGGLGLALIRDGNGARSFETLLRYRGAAMAEFWRALRTLKALQAEQASGRAIARGRCRPGGALAPAHGAAGARPSSATERTRARPGPTAISPERAAHARRAARARRAVAAERTQSAAHPRLEAASAGSPVTPAAAVRSGNALATRRR